MYLDDEITNDTKEEIKLTNPGIDIKKIAIEKAKNDIERLEEKKQDFEKLNKLNLIITFRLRIFIVDMIREMKKRIEKQTDIKNQIELNSPHLSLNIAYAVSNEQKNEKSTSKNPYLFWSGLIFSGILIVGIVYFYIRLN